MNEHDNDWVVHLLAAAAAPAMPPDVAERLDRTLRLGLEDGGTASGSTDDAEADVPGPTPAAPVPAAPGAPAGAPSTGRAEAVDDTATTSDESDPDRGTATTATEVTEGPATGRRAGWAARARGAPPAVPPAARPALVPPAAETGAIPTARVTTPDGREGDARDGDGTKDQATGAEATGAGATGAEATGAGATVTRPGRGWGSSRREQRAEDLGERRRRLLTRYAPVAAGLLVLGGAGVAAVSVMGGQGDSATDSQDEVAAAGAAETVVPRALVATGTEYQSADRAVFDDQVRALVAVAGSGGSESSALSVPQEAGDGAAAQEGQDAVDDDAPSEESAPAGSGETDLLDPGAARAGVAASPLTDAETFQACVDEVTGASGGSAAAMDLAVVDGVESTVVVVPDATGESLFVYVVGPDCTVTDSQFDFFTITP